MDTQPAIEVKGLSLRRRITILDNIDWMVRQGEHWVILGANGSGKTTLLSALNAYIAPTSGTISIAGHTYGRYDWRELRKEIGMVSSSIRQKIKDQETALEVIASGEEAIINYWGDIPPALVEKAESLLQQVECDYLRDREWGYLSQGERQRVLIGRALMAKLRLLILDEPCAGLDPVAREKFLHFLKRFTTQQTETSVILVTHHVEEIIETFSHVLLLHQGKVLAQGPTDVVMTSSNLSKAFAAEIGIIKEKDRYSLTITATEH